MTWYHASGYSIRRGRDIGIRYHDRSKKVKSGLDPFELVAKEGTILCKPLPTWNHFSQILFGMVCRFWSEPLHFVVLFIAHINMV
jgi:hypothetical protein